MEREERIAEMERLHVLGRHRRYAGNLDGATRAIRRAIGLGAPGPVLLHELGMALLAGGDAPGAVHAIEQAVALQPDLVPAWYDLAVARRAAGDEQGACGALENAASRLLIELDAQALLDDGGTTAAGGCRSPGPASLTVPYMLKLVVAGPVASGKSELVQHVSTTRFTTDHKLTVGAAFSFWDAVLEDGTTAKIMLWDLASEQRFRFLLGDYCRGASGAMICFDATDLASFEQVPWWLDVVRRQASHVPVMLVGTRSDLPGQQVPLELAAREARDAGCVGAAYCTVTDGGSVDHAFGCMARWMIHHVATAPGR